jgi:hypothetical protein
MTAKPKAWQHNWRKNSGAIQWTPGPLANARVLEPLAFLWIYLAFKQGHGAGIAHSLMHR